MSLIFSASCFNLGGCQKSSLLLIRVSSVLICGSLVYAARAGEKATPQQLDHFEKHVRPVLAEQCWSCHGPKKQSGGVRLDSRQGILGESDHGPIVVPGKPEQSALVRAIRHTGDIKMPPKEKLAAP